MDTHAYLTLDVEGNSTQYHQPIWWSATCIWKPTPLWRSRKDNLFVSTNFGMIWSSRLLPINEYSFSKIEWWGGWGLSIWEIIIYMSLEHVYMWEFGVHVLILVGQSSLIAWRASLATSLIVFLKVMLSLLKMVYPCNEQHQRARQSSSPLISWWSSTSFKITSCHRSPSN